MDSSEASPATGGAGDTVHGSAGGSSPEFPLPCAMVHQMGCGFALWTQYDIRNLPWGKGGGFLVNGDERKVACDSKAEASIHRRHRVRGSRDRNDREVAKRVRHPS
jgi:hypothetical protein